MPDLVFLDLRLPDGNGIGLLEELKRDVPHVEVVVITAHVDVDLARRSLLLGAADLIEKPFQSADVTRVIEGVVALPRALREEPRAAGALIGNSPRFMRACHELVLLAGGDAPGLLIGELGTGRELISHAVHDASRRSEGPFVAASCVTLSAAELLGSEPGALPAVPDGREGLIEQASGGTLYLRQVHELSAELQGHLLGFLRGGEVSRLGGLSPRPWDVRLVVSTDQDPQALVGQGRLREDLYYELAVMPIAIPPLRERDEDVVLLARHFLQAKAHRLGRGVSGFSAAAIRRLRAHPWPGNVRELRNVVERSLILAQGQRVELGDLRIAGEGEPTDAGPVQLSLPDYRIASAEKALILLALERTRGHKSMAAQLLGINRATLYNKLKAFGLKAPRD